MLIDWFTVVAQAVNFLILVWLMKRYLYQPILNALDAREKRIAAELADADTKKAEAETEREEFKRKNDEFEGQRAALLAKVMDEAAAERQRLLDAVRKDAESLRVKLQDTLGKEHKNLQEELARRTQAEVFSIAHKALKDLADTDLEGHMAEVFIRRLRELDAGTRGKWAALLKTSEAPVLVRSAFGLGPEQCALIGDAVKEIFGTEIPVRFEIVPNLVSGIELVMQGQKIAWSITDYLASLEQDVDDLLKTQKQPEGHINNTSPS